MRKLTLILVLLAGILFLVSCRSIRDINGAIRTDIDSKEDLQIRDYFRDVLLDYGFDADLVETVITAKSSGYNNTSGYAIREETHEPVPIEMFLFREGEYDSFNRYSNNSYYCYTVVPEEVYPRGAYECMDFFLMADYDNNVEYLSVAVIGHDGQEGWSNLTDEFLGYVYFRFVGYSYEIDCAVGIFDFYEPDGDYKR